MEVQAEAGEALAAPSASFALKQEFHVLVVEDDNVTLKTVEALLRKLNYKVSSARNGREALKFLESAQASEQPVDLILTDILMPEVTGFDLINEVVHGVSYCNVPGEAWCVSGAQRKKCKPQEGSSHSCFCGGKRGCPQPSDRGREDPVCV